MKTTPTTNSRLGAAQLRKQTMGERGYREVLPVLPRSPKGDEQLVFPRWKQLVDRIGLDKAVELVTQIPGVRIDATLAAAIDAANPPTVFVRTSNALGDSEMVIVFTDEDLMPEHGRTPRYHRGDVGPMEGQDFFDILRDTLDRALSQ